MIFFFSGSDVSLVVVLVCDVYVHGFRATRNDIQRLTNELNLDKPDDSLRRHVLYMEFEVHSRVAFDV